MPLSTLNSLILFICLISIVFPLCATWYPFLPKGLFTNDVIQNFYPLTPLTPLFCHHPSSRFRPPPNLFGFLIIFCKFCLDKFDALLPAVNTKYFFCPPLPEFLWWGLLIGVTWQMIFVEILVSIKKRLGYGVVLVYLPLNRVSSWY